MIQDFQSSSTMILILLLHDDTTQDTVCTSQLTPPTTSLLHPENGDSSLFQNTGHMVPSVKSRSVKSTMLLAEM